MRRSRGPQRGFVRPISRVPRDWVGPASPVSSSTPSDTGATPETSTDTGPAFNVVNGCAEADYVDATTDAPASNSPEADLYATYEFLGYVLEVIVQALSS